MIPKLLGFSCLPKFIFALMVVDFCFVETTHMNRAERFTKKDKCKDSTPEKVRTCPQGEADIQERARMMKCDSYPECHGEELVYHCVRFITDLVEVCAPNLRIVCDHKSGGCCAVFEEGLGRVIVDPNSHCQDCPWHYHSNETSKYSACVQAPQTPTSSTEHRVTVRETNISNEFAKSTVSLPENITDFTSKEEESSPKVYLIVISTVLSAIVITGCTGFFCFKGKRKKNRRCTEYGKYQSTSIC
nr:uncharacterized protein LOC117692182 [Crassostrea gigas]